MLDGCFLVCDELIIMSQAVGVLLWDTGIPSYSRCNFCNLHLYDTNKCIPGAFKVEHVNKLGLTRSKLRLQLQ